jgi:hypothetical protein
MPKTSINGLTLFYDAAKQDTADLIRNACERSVRLSMRIGGWRPPKAATFM